MVLLLLLLLLVVSFLLLSIFAMSMSLLEQQQPLMDWPYRNRTLMSVIVSLYGLACCGQIKCTHGKLWNNMHIYNITRLKRCVCAGEQQRQSFSWFCLPQNVTKCKIATIKIEMTEQRNDTFVNNRLTTWYETLYTFACWLCDVTVRNLHSMVALCARGNVANELPTKREMWKHKREKDTNQKSDMSFGYKYLSLSAYNF